MIGLGSESSERERGVAPGDLLAGRWRVAGIAAAFGGAVLVNALDERLRKRVRVLVGDAVGRGFVHPMLPTPLAVEADGHHTCVAFAWWEGAPLELPARPLRTQAEVAAWTRRIVAVLGLLERIHEETGRAHGHLSTGSFWSAANEGLVMVDLLAAAEPDARFQPAEADPADPRTDLYALAGLFFALATGELPFGVGAHAVVAHRLMRPPDTEALPAPLLDVLRTALQKQPHHRFASAGRMKAAFEQAQAELDGRPLDALRAPERVPLPGRTPEPPAGLRRRLRAGARRASGAPRVLALGAVAAVVGWGLVLAVFAAIGWSS